MGELKGDYTKKRLDVSQVVSPAESVSREREARRKSRHAGPFPLLDIVPTVLPPSVARTVSFDALAVTFARCGRLWKKRGIGLAHRLSYSSWRRHQCPVSFRPLGARSSHCHMPQRASTPRA